MTGFDIIGDINDSGAKKVPIDTITVSLNELLTLVPGATTWTEATSSTKFYYRKAIALEAATTAATSVLVQELDGTETIKASCTSTAATADNGDSMVLTDSLTVNNTGTNSTDDAICFVQDGIAGTYVVGRIMVGNGADVNAT